ncbi:hypothetical protein AVEN_186903-1 [Araneus ventricosus]|uniref:Uncharacterized protein n=1 Tax=Araneus ventricosus TaxID=182803 RepID=A0A4Y2XDT1_ARAVE|nr:hypothetical protein AVEN_189890-1 [Araneus ventricosus]GBO46587.1 hypothetical protein AVEN_121521-1 [Araneus ventricosus]GBO46588.1 hypothetical protein AVEN_129439-1 [Araneus ventricosus]GBO46594.1 hypothetical protein AVEN_186903-1 [Araneus ventricosus]
MFLVRKERWVPLVTPESGKNQKRGDVIPEQERQSVFDEFWLTMSWNLKKMFLLMQHRDIKSTKRKTEKGDDTHAFDDSTPCEEESRRQVPIKRKNTEHVSDGKNKKVKIDETDKKKKGVIKDKKTVILSSLFSKK